MEWLRGMLHVFEPCLSIPAVITGELQASSVLSVEVARAGLNAKGGELHHGFDGGCGCRARELGARLYWP